jgi:hypothetical protein
MDAEFKNSIIEFTPNYGTNSRQHVSTMETTRRPRQITAYKCRRKMGKGKVKISLLQAMEAHRVARG